MQLKIMMLALTMSISMVIGNAYAEGHININTASAEQLQTVKGIGEKTAEAIVKYREAHGTFETVDALVHVKGIGEKKLDKIDDDLVVE